MSDNPPRVEFAGAPRTTLPVGPVLAGCQVRRSTVDRQRENADRSAPDGVGCMPDPLRIVRVTPGAYKYSLRPRERRSTTRDENGADTSVRPYHDQT